MLTGYGNLPTAVAAIKAGAIDYMAKPVDADDVEAALLASPESKAKPPENPMSADRVKWEHIHRVFELCNRNVSETARRLKMHRRTLQRILSKKDRQDKFDLFIKVANTVKINILNNSAGKKGNAPKANTLLNGTKLSNQIRPKI